MAKKRGRPPKNPPPPPPPPAPDPADQSLSEPEQRFVDEYWLNENLTRAYLAVYPDSSYRNAYAGGRLFLARPHVQAELRARRHAARVRHQVRADNILREWGYIGFSDIGDVFDANNRLLPTRQIPLATRRAIKSVKIRRERVQTRTDSTRHGKTTVETTVTIHECEVEVVFHDKLAALEKLGRSLGLQASIPPLEVLLSALPPAVAESVRGQLMAPQQVPSQGGQK